MTKDFLLDQLVMTGFNHKQCPLEIREKVSFTHININNAYEKLKADGIIKEAVILSTCNRSEIYAVVADFEEGTNYLKTFYAQFFNLNKLDLQDYIILRSSKDTIRHIFEVACGFQSMVLGEDQILGQVKDSYEQALKYKSTGKVLNRLFIDSITTAKRIKASTGISENALSVSSIGVKLIEQKLNSLSGKSALVIGLGEMSKIAVQNMQEKQIGRIFVTNRTRRKVIDFINEFPQITEIDFKNRYEVMGSVDIIISCTSAPHFVVYRDKFIQYYKNQRLCVLDLAIPRDIEPSINDFDNLELYRLDDLEKIAQENIEKRLVAKEKGLKIIEHDIKRYIKWTEESKIIDSILKIQEYSRTFVTKELDSLRKKLGEIDESQMVAIEKSLINLAKSLAHKQMMDLKTLVGDKQEYQEALDEFLTDKEEQ